MKTADILREAALHGPFGLNGHDAGAVGHWIGWGTIFDEVRDFCQDADPKNGLGYDFRYGTNTERRMFLLFVAEALS